MSEPSTTIYRWGAWVWYYRLFGLFMYCVVVGFAVGLYFIGQLVLQSPSISGIAGWIACFLLTLPFLYGAWLEWHAGYRNVSVIMLSSDQTTLLVQTRNFRTRHIAVADLGAVDYRELERYYRSRNRVGSTNLPRISVAVRDAPPLVIDLGGQIIEPARFKTLFGYDSAHPLQIGGKRKKQRGRQV